MEGVGLQTQSSRLHGTMAWHRAFLATLTTMLTLPHCQASVSTVYLWPLNAKSGGYEVRRGVDALSPTLSDTFVVDTPPPSGQTFNPLWLDGASGVDCPFEDTNQVSDWTLALYVFPDVLGGTLVHYKTALATSKIYEVRMALNPNGTVSLAVSIGGATSVSLTTASAVVQTNTWQQVMAVRGGSNLGVTVNGNSKGSVALSSNYPLYHGTGKTVRFGGVVGGTDFYKGKITCATLENSVPDLPRDFTDGLYIQECVDRTPSSGPKTVLRSSLSDASQGLAHQLALDNTRGRVDKVTGVTASTWETLCPRYGSAYPGLYPATRLDGSPFSVVELSVSSGLFQSSFSLAVFLRLTAKQSGVVFSWERSQAASGVARVELAVREGDLVFTVTSVTGGKSSTCGALTATGLTFDSWLLVLAQRSADTRSLSLTLEPGTTVSKADTCSGDTTAKAVATRLLIGGDGAVSIRGLLQCMTVYSRAVQSTLTADALKTLCSSGFATTTQTCSSSFGQTNSGMAGKQINIPTGYSTSSLETITVLRAVYCASACILRPYCRSYVINTAKTGAFSCYLLDYVDITGSPQPGLGYYILKKT